MPNYINGRLFRRNVSALVLTSLALATSGSIAAQAQSFDTSNVGGVTMGPNGPQGFLNLPNTPTLMNVPQGGGPGFTIIGGTQAERSMAATGEQAHMSARTGHNSDPTLDLSPRITRKSNPVMGNGANFGLRKTETGLMAPGSFDGSALPVNNRHFDYGFNQNQGGYYQSMYGADRAVNNFLGGILPGILTSSRQRLPPVSQGSVDIDIAPNHGR